MIRSSGPKSLIFKAFAVAKSFREFLISQEEMSDNELEDEEEKFLYKHIYDKKIRGKIINELELLLYNKK